MLGLSLVQAQSVEQALTFKKQFEKVNQTLSLEQSLNILEEKHNVNFIYKSDLVKGELVPNNVVEAKDFQTALTRLSNLLDIKYEQIGRRSFLLSKPIEVLPKVSKVETITGTVSDAQSGETLPGVNVVIQGTTTGTSTDAEGMYKLSAPSMQDTLVFSFVGYETQTVPINGRTEVDVAMQSQTVAGGELVVVGYETQEAATSTGSITNVGGEQIEKAPVVNIENSLVGRLPGLVAINNTGQPGSSGSTIQIRGSNTLGDNSPLVVIDGVTNRTGGLSRLNPNDIEDITVLKDASAAIYGSQAANGVILVTTKKGQAGDTRVSFSYNQGFTQPTRIPEMADAATYAQMINEIDMYRGREPRHTQEDIQKYRQGTDPWTHPNTDWFDAAFKDVSMQNKLNASVSGGSEQIQYYLSVGAASEDGYFNDSGFKYDQYNFRSNISGEINDFINLSLSIAGRREGQEAPIRSAGETFRALMRGKPTLPAYWPNGQPGPDIEYGDNPVVTGTQATGYDSDKRDVFQSNLKVEVEVPFVEGLVLESNVSYDKNYEFNKLWATPWYLYTWDYQSYDENGDPVRTRAQRGLNEPQLTEDMNDEYQSTLNLLGRYRKDLEDHSFSLLAGIERQESRSNFFSAYRQGFLTNQLDELNVGGDAQKDNSGSSINSIRMNYFGRINYNYKEKYLFEFVGRYDGSYIFPEGDRFGFFPAISLGWRLSEEPFWDDILPFFEGFKLRGSWGQTGNDRIEPYQYLTTYEFGTGYVRNVNELQKSLVQSRISNPNVTWEVANQFNVGLDTEMLDGRLAIQADYFRYFRDKILWWRNASIPTTAGFTLPRENIGEVINRGVDGRITYTDQIGDFNYDVSVNAGYAQNEIQYWDEAPGAPEWQQSTGHPMNTELYYETDGVFNDQEELDSYPHWPGARPGYIKFVDINEDGVINGQDRVRIDKIICQPLQGD
ncbi:MAG: TonB-dependent receptor [Balneolaceae bacterium]|nr:TonB-dependent receptor [Balneolaceae bacterium]